MIIKGRCRGNGAQMAAYLVDTRENDRAEILAIYGSATPNDLKRSLLQMSLTSEITGRTKNGLYHCQLSPRIEEAQAMTPEQKLRMVELLTRHLDMPKYQKWVLSEQEKDGRIHFHVAYQRYDEATGKMWNDDKNYAKHKAASRAMEKEFGWKITYDKTNRLDQDIKDYILDLWDKSRDPSQFVDKMAKAGFEVTQGIDKRPYQIVDQHGTVFDLSRQLAGVKQKDVSEALNPIRKDLRETTEASKQLRRESQSNLEKSDKPKELSDSQELAAAMIEKVKIEQKQVLPHKNPDKFPQKSEHHQLPKTVQEPKKQQPAYTYTVSVRHSPALSRQKVEPEKSDKMPILSDKKPLDIDNSNAKKLQLKIDEGRKQTEQQYTNPVTGEKMTQEAYQRLQQYIERAEARNKDRDRGQGRERDRERSPD